MSSRGGFEATRPSRVQRIASLLYCESIMTTTRKLWLGFGALMALLVLSVGAIFVRLQSIEGNVRAEQLVQENREWLRVTLASIGDAVLATDLAGRITFLNPIAAQLTGWTQAEAVGQPAAEVSSTKRHARRSRTRLRKCCAKG